MKKIGKDRHKCVVYESTLSTAARSPFPKGEGYDTRMPLFSHCQSEYTHMWKKNNDGQSLPCVGKVASEASRIGYWRYEREWEIVSSRRYKSTRALLRVSLSQKGEAKRRGLRRPKRKPTPPRCARQPLPREGARVDAPSLGRRGPEGAEVGWGKRDKKDRGRSSQVCRLREHPIHRCAVPLPHWGRLRYENAAFLALSERIHAYVEKRITTDKAFPSRGRCPEGADRVLAV